MAAPGDLHWERISAGLYRTQFWANGYRYKIEKDDYYANTWYIYYQWHKMKNLYSENRWVKYTRAGSSFTTLKHAKQVALYHNLRPRRKFEFVGRATEEHVGELRSYGFGLRLGYLMYKEVDWQGKIRITPTWYMNPKEIGGPDQEKINAEKLAEKHAKNVAQTAEALSKVHLKVPEGIG